MRPNIGPAAAGPAGPVATALHNRFASRLLSLLPMIRCSESAQKSAVQVCQVATVVMETTQLVLSQFKNFLSYSMQN